MSIRTFNTQLGPKAIGPYSTIKIYNATLYVSGQIGLDPTTGNMVSDSLEEQTHRAMLNLKTVLSEVGCKMEQILRCTLYLTVKQ